MSTLGVALTILGIMVTAIPIYFLARSNARDNARAAQDRIDKAVALACAPLRDTIRLQQETLRDREKRIDQLEDELRRGGRR